MLCLDWSVLQPKCARANFEDAPNSESYPSLPFSRQFGPDFDNPLLSAELLGSKNLIELQEGRTQQALYEGGRPFLSLSYHFLNSFTLFKVFQTSA